VKQTIFMAVLTLVGVLGPFVVDPFVGLAVYYFFAVLRPQYLWLWALPSDIGWSEYVAWATIVATVWFLLTSQSAVADGGQQRRFSGAHKAFFLFVAWICMTYTTSLNQDVAWPWFLEYLKIFLMFAVATVVVRELRQVWWLYLLSTVALIYIAYELNYVYFTAYRMDIYFNGYGGLDNNGAGLMLAMGIPLAIGAWEASTKAWKWIFIAAVPVLMHAVLMSFSRGAMVSLLAAVPLLFFRSRRKRQFSFLLVLLLISVPYLAGKEIQARFFSIEKYETDRSANTRLDSWNAAIEIANDYPVFGVGIRNSNLLTIDYGTDQGRVIHSQYLALLADAGYPGLALYLLAIISTFVSIFRTRRTLKARSDPEARRAHSMLNGIEGALFVFCVGATFLALEVFELPYVMVLLGAQISLLARLRTAEAPRPAAAPVRTVQLPVAHRA
jgi:probable O-glycosylation ligase (exosortase A-associated)